jgi:hypothetical protein
LFRGIIDTEDHKIGDFKVAYLGEFKFIFKTTCGSGAQRELFDEKN